jgi:hypothetical protein
MYRTIEDEPLQTEGDCRLALRTNTHTLLDDTPQRGLKILRGPGFLAVFDSAPCARPLTPSNVNRLSLFLSLPVRRRSSLLTEKGGRGRVESNRPKERLALYKWFDNL